jgi:excisionase family DNA binding protein
VQGTGDRHPKFVAGRYSGIDDVAKILDCSRSHVSNLFSGRVPGVPPIPHIRAGRLRRVRREALMEWFRQQETA